MAQIVLVSCVSKKRDFPTMAQDLYVSDWFLKASVYAKEIGDRWFILSAKYGLVPPNKTIEPYNVTLKSMSVNSRLMWAVKVINDLGKFVIPGDMIVFLAGVTYREHLVDPIRKMNCRISIPMEGLRIGEQMQWLNQQIRGRN